MNTHVIIPYHVIATDGVTEKVAPSVAITHFHENLAKIFNKTNRRYQAAQIHA
jgi:hypothetical protein